MTDSPHASLSPSATPPKQRKRKPDPFLELANSPISSPLASPESAHQHDASDGSDESFLKRIVVTPLLLTSFIVSLLLVDRRNRAYRLAEHPPQSAPSWWARLSPWQWLDPQPYQDPTDSTWRHANIGQAAGGDGSIPGIDGQAELDRRQHKQKRWFVGKKHRKVARLELSDAFEMRGRVLVELGIAWLLGMLALYWASRKLVAAVW